MFDFTAAVIAALVGTIMTLFFAYFPRVRVWYASMPVENQSLFKLGLMVVTSIAFFVASLFPALGIFPAPLTPLELGSVVVALIVTNAPVASYLPATRDVREAIRKRNRVENRI